MIKIGIKIISEAIISITSLDIFLWGKSPQAPSNGEENSSRTNQHPPDLKIQYWFQVN